VVATKIVVSLDDASVVKTVGVSEAMYWAEDKNWLMQSLNQMPIK